MSVFLTCEVLSTGIQSQGGDAGKGSAPGGRTVTEPLFSLPLVRPFSGECDCVLKGWGGAKSE